MARAVRLYSVVVPTLLLTASLDFLGSLADPDLYSHYDLLFGNGIWHLPICAIFLNEIWDAHVSPGTNGAYWSLSYEVIYYVLFGFGFYGRGWTRLLGCIACCIVCGPRILSLFPLWLLGFAAYHVSTRLHITWYLGWAGFVGSIFAALWLNAWARKYGFLSHFSALFDYGLWEVVQSYALALIFVISLISFNVISDSFSFIIRRSSSIIRWLAGGTFTLYLLHTPLLLAVRAMLPSAHDSWQYQMILVGVPIGIVFCVAQVTERKKEIWRLVFDRLLERWQIAVQS